MKRLILLLSLLFAFNLTAQTIYKTIPGKPYKDITEPLMVIEKNGIYPVIPGTTIRDYSEMRRFVIE